MAKILILDDLPSTLRMLSLILEKMGGHEVVAVESGMEAVEAFEEAHRDNAPFALAILDQDMPMLSGLDVTAIIRQREAERHRDKAPLRVVILSAHLAPGADKPVHEEDVTRLDIADLWGKPFEMAPLLNDVTAVLGQEVSA